MLTQKRLKELFKYKPDTGEFVRIRTVTHNAQAGDVPSCRNTQGYVVFRIEGKLYRRARLAVLYMTGDLPSAGMQVDHINHIRDDDRWDNLRVISQKQNLDKPTLELLRAMEWKTALNAKQCVQR